MKLRLILLLGTLCLAGCEILEQDISRKQVPVFGPADGVSVPTGKVAFRWGALEGAAGYEFLLVAPSFDAVERIVKDTVIYADTLDRHFGCSTELPAGKYAWSVAGFNAGYRSEVVCRTLTVVPSDAPSE